jgi:BirA family transcriptional regulator, biotin operon repressor / biotin---[acetyl-CoA-carboxylase] ligase
LKRIKLDAIDSTNSFLKELARNSALENFTTVTTNHQKKGRGQQASSWVSEKGKNLTFSTFVSFLSLELKRQRYLNFAISLAVLETLNNFNVSNLRIKWPNDILVGDHKIAGILIENSIYNSQIQSSIIGIGLNVNQETFASFHRKATSLKICMQKEFDLELVLQSILESLVRAIALLNEGSFDLLEQQYLHYLYKKNVPTTFKNSKNILFMGMIQGVSSEGKLQILLENSTVKEFGIKEVSFA